MVLQSIQDRTGITADKGIRVDDKHMEFLMNASHKMARGDSVNVAVCWLLCSKVKVSRGIKPSPPNGL